MTISPTIINHLPAHLIADELNSVLRNHNSAVVTAPPGAGKSTLLPLTILDALEDGGKVIVLEPRRLAARQIAERMASMIGEEVGQTVGYRVRYDTQVSAETRIEVVTEGILTRMLVNDSTLDGVSVVVFDEFHERSINSDVALALTRESQSIIRPDLKLVIMSATIDTTLLCSALNAPLVQSEGRMYPVEVIYCDETIQTVPYIDVNEEVRTVVRTILRAHREHQGDILVFLPGEAEIRRTEEMLGDSLGETKVCPLYGMLGNEQQRTAIAPSREGERKVVLATSIAETSITIEGVRIVIDTGLCRTMLHDARTGLSHLETVRVSMDMAGQRCGRAGRVAPGVCYRLWAKAEECRMDECRRPEIETADLTAMVLDVAAWGEMPLDDVHWLTEPPRANVWKGRQLLQALGAIDKELRITKHGRQVWRNPYHPRIANMLVMAERIGEKQLARKIADMLEMPPSQMPKSLDQPGVGRLLAWAYPERIARHINEGVGRYRLACGDTATVDADDLLAAHEWIVVASMNAVGNGRVFLGAELTEKEVEEHAVECDNLMWDNKQGCIVARREKRIGVLVVSQRPLSDCPREELHRIICEAAVKHGTSMLDFNDHVTGLQQRIATVAEWHPELDLPDVSTDAVLSRAADWLPMYLGKATTTAELKKIDLTAALWGLLDYTQQQEVDSIAPTHIVMPNGHRIRVEYRIGQQLPVLRVRLQECFGMEETPRVDRGQRPILMELLSPGFKPVQLTQDLRSFWAGTYFEVRKELRRRYPKHAWPENPNQN